LIFRISAGTTDSLKRAIARTTCGGIKTTTGTRDKRLRINQLA
jgi:hypothetical protein